MSLAYNDKKIPDRVRISPSSLFNYWDNPYRWYKNCVIGTKSSPNDSIVIGSLLHNRIERFYLGLDPIDRDDEGEYITLFDSDPTINSYEIVKIVDRTWDGCVLKYVSEKGIKPDAMEQWVEFIPNSNPDVYIGGTYDYRYGTTIGDYKSCSTLPKSISISHKMQLAVYAWLLRLQGVNIDTFEITYIKKWKATHESPTTGKQIGGSTPEIIVLKEPIREEDITFVVSEMKRIGTKISMCKKDPSLVELFFNVNVLSKFNS